MTAPRALGYFVPAFPTQTHAFFWREVAALRAQGVKVVLFSSRRPRPEDCPHAFGEDARAETHYVFPPRPGAVLRWAARHPAGLVRALGYLRELQEGGAKARAKVAALLPSAADICAAAEAAGVGHVHFHSCADAAHLGALAERMGGPSYSVTVHGNLDVYGTDHAAKFARAALVTTVTRPLRNEVLAVAPGRDVPVITMGVDTARFVGDRPSRPADAPLQFLSISRLNPVKGHVYFLKALRRLIDAGHAAHYRIAGSGEAESAIRAEIARLSLGDQVSMLGPLGQDDVRAALGRADAFVLTSFGHGEAAPVAVMEAMAAGLPVICSRIGGTGDMITDGVDGFLVPQQDVDAITEAARKLCTDEALRVKIGRAAQQRAQSQFDTAATARALWEAICAARGR
ncbi:Putative teichuronic acid biosynthesis glycosyltransferase TuaC [Roseivivax sp. THAF40]|uniref:glycosyltransferase n=1 Tax=unclassified Roseivivax TaxID=2639302 RepID=UPI001268D4B5|nr:MULTISPECIES: glycosyltransferase [unclassified Roseivivax]QFS82080.1 Putative teichuronic acid biosynthesis glycosyltransferase TuaC [Roseivivax sp. THAF197b]QFT45880.1 Putative teichuronic acid biosynthesis glycosyltransferase TuaC [Roseivivax sp. THAF40]